MIKLKTTFNVPIKKIYDAWLSGAKHGAMTGAKATGSTLLGGKFTAWDGYISGHNLQLVPHTKIVQSWRTSEFTESDPDSILTIALTPTKTGTTLTLTHSKTPKKQESSYRQGWQDHYFAPMHEYFD